MQSPDIDIERGGMRVGFRTAVAVVIALIGVTIGGVTTWAQVATKAELELQRRLFNEHIASLEEKAEGGVELAEKNARLLLERDRLAGKLDFLIEAQLEQARTNPRAKRAVEKAMVKVRARAKAAQKPDPIADLVL